MEVRRGRGRRKERPEPSRVWDDEESGEVVPEKRGLHLQNGVLVTLTLILVVATLGAGFRQIATEVEVDGSFLRCTVAALTPIQVSFTLLFRQVIIRSPHSTIQPGTANERQLQVLLR